MVSAMETIMNSLEKWIDEQVKLMTQMTTNIDYIKEGLPDIIQIYKLLLEIKKDKQPPLEE